MKRFTKMFLTLALLCVAGSVSAQEKVYASFENPTNTAATWDKSTSSFKWSQSWYNQIKNIGLPNGDISNFKTLGIDYEFISGDQFRILFYCGGSNLTIYVTKTDNGESGLATFNIYESLKDLSGFSTDFLLKCDEICLSGAGGSGEVKVNSMYLETYAPNEEKPSIIAEEEEQDPGKPSGNYVDFTEAFSNLSPVLGKKIGNGEVVVGARSQSVVADLADYSKLTIVTSPNMKLVLYMNHEVAAQQNAPDYSEADAGKYVFMDVQADENGLIEVDLTQFDKKELNCICLPWDNSNKGTVWYLLLTEATTVPVTISDAGYATFCSKKAVTLESSVEAYAVELAGSSALLIPVESSIDANTPVILKAAAGDYELGIVESGNTPEKNDLQVSDGSVAGDGTIYVLANGGSGVGFYLLADGVKVPAGKAYLVANAGGREFIGFAEDATAIKSIETTKANGAIYNLAGQQVKNAQKGVFIIDGKKVIK